MGTRSIFSLILLIIILHMVGQFSHGHMVEHMTPYIRVHLTGNSRTRWVTFYFERNFF